MSEFIVYDQAQVHIRYLLRLTTNPTTKAADGATGDATVVAAAGAVAASGTTATAKTGIVRPRIDLTGTGTCDEETKNFDDVIYGNSNSNSGRYNGKIKVCWCICWIGRRRFVDAIEIGIEGIELPYLRGRVTTHRCSG